MQINMEQFLMLLNPAYRQPVNIQSSKPTTTLVNQQKLKNYPNTLRQIYLHFFNENKTKIQINKIMPLQQKKTKVPVCNKVFSRTQQIYRCYDCLLHQAAVFCVACFESGNHEGHRFKKINSGGGNCDCGNPIALRKESFCPSHSGQVQIPQISEQQQCQFQLIISQMFEWFFKLINNKQQIGLTYLVVLVQFLIKLNQESIYYNVLSFRFLTKKRFKDNCYIDQIFKFKQQRLARVFNQLFFSMFSLQEFKSILADRYVTAYNTIPLFQLSQYHSLYIQLFANDDVVLAVTNKYKNTLSPKKQNFNLQCLIQDLGFICSIAEQPAICFFRLFFQVNKCVPCEFLNEIEKQLEINNQMHAVDLVTKNMKDENKYYYIYCQLLKKIKNDSQLLNLVIKNLFEKICKKEYSYKKNRAILPYHRIFAVGLFTAFKGNLSNMTPQSCSSYLGTSVSQLKSFCQQQLKIVLNCLFDFAQTYARRNYFDNYILIYVRDGVCCINFDFLFIKEVAILMKALKLDFSLVLKQMFQEALIRDRYQNPAQIRINDIKKQLKMESQIQMSTTQEYINTWLYFYELLIQVSTTQCYQILNHQRLKLEDKGIESKKRQIFMQMLSQLGSATKQELQVIKKYFLYGFGGQFLQKNALFNKTNKKYYIQKTKQTQKSSKQLSFDYNFHFSKRKTGQQLFRENQLKFPQQEGNQMVDQSLQIQRDKYNQLLSVIAPQNSITQLAIYIQQASKKINNQKQFQTVINNLKNVLTKLKLFLPQASVEKQRYKKVTQILKTLSQNIQTTKSSKNQKQGEKLRLEKLEKIKNKKMEKFKHKQISIMKKMEQNQFVDKNMSQQKQFLCILCKQDKQGLCYFANMKFKNRFGQSRKISSQKQKYRNEQQNTAGNINKFICVFNSCFHTTHFTCYQSMSNQVVKLNCPLCKSFSNILLPIHTQYQNSAFLYCTRRIGVISNQYKSKAQVENFNSEMVNPKGNNYYNKQQTIHSILEYLVQYIGFAGVINHQEFQKKLWRVGKQLFNILFLIQKDMKNEQVIALIQDLQAQYKSYEYVMQSKINKNIQQQVTQNLEKLNNNQRQRLLSSVRLCVLKYCKETIINGQLNLQPQSFYQIYQKVINREDLQLIRYNLELVLTNNDPEKQIYNQNNSRMEQSVNEDKIPRVESLFIYYQPPKNPKELIKLRDKLTAENCKTGHNVCICCQCEQILCVDCKTVAKHSKIHGTQSMYFSLLTGGVIFYVPRQIFLPSLYENKFGVSWTSNKEPEGFQLNEQLYKKLNINLNFNTVQNLLRIQFPEFLNGIFIEFD